jgi:hypothetical protein
MKTNWSLSIGDKFTTRSGYTVVIVSAYDGNYLGSNGVWYDALTGEDGWSVMGVDHPHSYDLVKKVKE